MEDIDSELSDVDPDTLNEIEIKSQYSNSQPQYQPQSPPASVAPLDRPKNGQVMKEHRGKHVTKYSGGPLSDVLSEDNAAFRAPSKFEELPNEVYISSTP